MSTTPEVGSPGWHAVHHAGEGQHHVCDYDVCVEWSMRQVPRPQPAEARGCRRITDPAPTPFAVEPGSRRTCIQMLAEGYHHANDMCPACTGRFMSLLDPDGSLSWHEEYVKRASEGVTR